MKKIKIHWYELFTFSISSQGFNHLIWDFGIYYPKIRIIKQYHPDDIDLDDIDPDDIPF